MPYEIKKCLNEGYIEIVFIPPIEVDEYFEVQEKYLHMNTVEKINNFIVDVSALVVQNFDQKDVIVKFAESWNIDSEDDIYIALILPRDFDSQNEVYLLTQLSRMQGMKMDTFYADDIEKARTIVSEKV